MPKEIVVTALSNRIEYATTDGKGLITGKREDVTEQAINAVYAYFKKEHARQNKEGKGYGAKFEDDDGGRLLYVAPGVELVWAKDQTSINWLPYSYGKTHLPIGDYLMSDGEYVCRANVDYYPSDDEFTVFLEERTRIDGPEAVTHYAVINLPKKMEENTP